MSFSVFKLIFLIKIFHFSRSLFPVVSLKLSGILPTEKYSVTLNFVNVDSAKYRYTPIKNRWLQWSTTPPDTTASTGRRLYEHPSSPALGAYWTTGMVTFDKLRLTNNFSKTEKHMVSDVISPLLSCTMSRCNINLCVLTCVVLTSNLSIQVHLSSLRKHRIQVIVTKLQCSHCHQPHVRMVELPLTEFFAVTGYRNNKITQLKIEYNPSSAAFRDEYKLIRDSRKRFV